MKKYNNLRLFEPYYQYSNSNTAQIIANLNELHFNEQICEFRDCFLNLDKSNGYLLDIIGMLLLLPRPYYSEISETYYYDSKILYNTGHVYDHGGLETRGALSDKHYRLLLKAKAISQNIVPTWDNIIKQLQFVFPGAHIKLTLIEPMVIKATVNDTRYDAMTMILNEISKYICIGQGVSLVITENVMKFDTDGDEFDGAKVFA